MNEKDKANYSELKFYEEFNGEVFAVDSMKAFPQDLLHKKTEYNLFVLCNQGSIRLELINGDIRFSAGQMCILPSNKMLKGTVTSSDANLSVLCVSDKALKSILGVQIGIWNRAMYLQKTHVIDAMWVPDTKTDNVTLFQKKHSPLFKEIILSFLRTQFLLVCEQFELSADKTETQDECKSGVFREELLFIKFLDNLSRQAVKRHPVSFYADELCVTPKYLTVLCTRISGKPPIKWIMEYTMEDIYTQLRLTDKSLKEIAMQTGFPNTSFFGKFFREKSGMTPLEYRQQEHSELK
ncbi:MAG: AraC family transcriptional regulator [Prevotella sp.]|nr:AraC family transcriptional regulator [Prevotella sp.]